MTERKEDSRRDQRLTTYTTVAGLVLVSGAGSVAQAQPTQCSFTMPLDVGGTPTDLDFDGDLVNDHAAFGTASLVTKTKTKKTPKGKTTKTKTKNRVGAVLAGKTVVNEVPTTKSSPPKLQTFSTNDGVGSSLPSWQNAGLRFALGDDTNPVVFNFGFRFQSSGNTHYGWLRLQAGVDGPVTIEECAYETSPDTTIMVGDVPVELQSFSVE